MIDWRSEEPMRRAPLLAGAALVACGTLLIYARPHLLALPNEVEDETTPEDRLDAGDTVGAYAQEGRDRLLSVLPPNLFEWVGRGLIMLGGLVCFTRLLDLLIDDEGMDA